MFNPNFFASARPPAPFFRAKLTRGKQLIDCGLVNVDRVYDIVPIKRLRKN